MTRRSGRKGRRAASHASARISSTVGDASALLSVALGHHQAGELDRARELYEQVLATDPQHADGLQYLGILCDQCGDSQQAQELIRRAIVTRPDVAPYHDNLGTVLEHSGLFEDALSAYEEADRLEPGLAERACNIGLVLERLGRPSEAEGRYRAALALDSDDVDCRFALANLLKGRGDLHAATQAYREVLKINQAHVDARVNLGNSLQDRGQLTEALDEYRAAAALAPDNAKVYHNQGRALLLLERFADAQYSFEQALRYAPQFTEARLGLAQVLQRLGRFDRAYAAFRAVCAAEPANAQARAGLLRVARVFPPQRHDELLVAALLSALDAGEICASTFARTLGEQLAARARLNDDVPADDADALNRALALQQDPLFTLVLEQCVNVVPAIERWLCAVRRALLMSERGQLLGREPLLSSLALQCAANEYVFAVSDAEIGVVDALLAQLEPYTSAGLLGCEDAVQDLLLCGCYMPLTELWGAVGLVHSDGHEVGPWLREILRRAVAEPLREQAIAATIPALAPIKDPASITVREQYEENPYPRWRDMADGATFDSAQSELVEAALERAGDAAILVAGCGTGYEPLMLARRFPHYPLLAIDLSRTSLAYAARKAQELGVDSVEFMQADLLEAEQLQRKFQLITASGVLHHLADPLAGWRALTRCLDDGGMMKVALYSRRARATVNAARERVAALGLPATAEGVRALRASILAGHEPGLMPLLDSEDFYTTSVCRDLIFHPVEHQFDLEEVAAMLNALELQFEGFELPHPLIRHQFVESRLGEENDLAAWARFEESNPQTFEAMYVIWCRKKASMQDEG